VGAVDAANDWAFFVGRTVRADSEVTSTEVAGLTSALTAIANCNSSALDMAS
jgi:hypothetical protein